MGAVALLDLPLEEQLGIPAPSVHRRELGTERRPAAGRHGQGGIAEGRQRATEDTDGSWWHSELGLSFGPVSKPVLKSRSRAGGSVSASLVIAQAGGAGPWGLLTLLNQHSDGACHLGKFRAWPRMSRLRVKEYLQLP